MDPELFHNVRMSWADRARIAELARSHGISKGYKGGKGGQRGSGTLGAATAAAPKGGVPPGGGTLGAATGDATGAVPKMADSDQRGEEFSRRN